MAFNFNTMNIPLEETKTVGGFKGSNTSALTEEIDKIKTLFETQGFDSENFQDLRKIIKNPRLKDKFKRICTESYNKDMLDSATVMTESKALSRKDASLMYELNESNVNKLGQLFENSAGTVLTEAGNIGMNNIFVATQFPLMKENWVANTFKDYLETRVTTKPLINRSLMQPYLKAMDGTSYKIPQLFNDAGLDGGAQLNSVINAGRQYVFKTPIGIGTATSSTTAGINGGVIDLLTLSNGSRATNSALSMDVCICAIVFPNPDSPTTVSTTECPTSFAMPLSPIDAGTIANQYANTTSPYAGNPSLDSIFGVGYVNEQTSTTYTANAMGWANQPFGEASNTTANSSDNSEQLQSVPGTNYTVGYEPPTVLNGVNTANNTYVTSDGKYLIRKVHMLPNAATGSIVETVSAMSNKGTMVTDTITFHCNYRDGIVTVSSAACKAIGVVFGGTLSSENNLHTLSTYFETINYSWKIPAGEHLNASLSVEQFEDARALYDTNLQAVMLNQMALTLAEFKDWKQKTYLDENRELIQNDYKLYMKEVFNSNPGGNYSGNPIEYRGPMLKDTIEKIAIRMKQVFNSQDCFFAIIGNPLDVIYLDNVIWQYQDGSEVVGSSKLTYSFGISSGRTSYLVLSNNKIQQGMLKMIIRPRNDQYVSYLNYDYSFNIVNNYRNPMEQMLPNLMATQRFLVVDVIPMQSDIIIQNNYISSTTTYEGDKAIPGNYTKIVSELLGGSGDLVPNAPTQYGSDGIQYSAPSGTTSQNSPSTTSQTTN